MLASNNDVYAVDGDEGVRVIKTPYNPSPSPTSPFPPKGAVTTSTTATTAPLVTPSSTSKTTFHIYHSSCHFSITPQIDENKERLWFPKKKAAKLARQERIKDKSIARACADHHRPFPHLHPHPHALGNATDGVTDVRVGKLNATYRGFEDDEPTELHGNGDHRAEDVEGTQFFLYQPSLAFLHPPRVLRAGSPRKSTPVALVHNSPLWRVWKIQFGDELAAPGVIDPRGVVSWAHNGGSKEELKEDERALRGFRVRNWRVWGETGKAYVQGVQQNRREEKARARGNGVQAGGEAEWVDPDSGGSGRKVVGVVGDKGMDVTTPVRADEVVYLHWASPFSRDVRRYTFTYAGIEFGWKGTGTVKESRMCGLWLHFNHLKLVAKVPFQGSESKDPISNLPSAAKNKKRNGEKAADKQTREVCLGKYQCSLATRKSGQLELFDAAIWRFVMEHFPALLPGFREPRLGEDETGGGEIAEEVLGEMVRALKKTRLYAVFVATAMCMVIGDKQKRETVRKVIEILAAVGEGVG